MNTILSAVNCECEILEAKSKFKGTNPDLNTRVPESVKEALECEKANDPDSLKRLRKKFSKLYSTAYTQKENEGEKISDFMERTVKKIMKK